MKNTTIIFYILQIFSSEKEVKKFSGILGYVDTARKFTLYDLIEFFIINQNHIDIVGKISNNKLLKF